MGGLKSGRCCCFFVEWEEGQGRRRVSEGRIKWKRRRVSEGGIELDR